MPADLDRVLEREKYPFACPLFGLQREQVLALVQHAACGDGERRVAGKDLRERALARAVRSHDRVHLAGLDGEIDAAKNFLPPPLRRGGSRLGARGYVGLTRRYLRG